MRKKTLSFIILLLFGLTAYCQQFYVTTSGALLVAIDLGQKPASYRLVLGCADGHMFSIASSGNKLYYNSGGGVLNVVDITPGTPPVQGTCQHILDNVFNNSLTIDNNGILYSCGGNEIFSIDLSNPQLQSVGTMPYFLSGDLAFYDGELYAAAPEGLIKVRLGDPSLSKVYIPYKGADMYGLASTTVNGQPKMYGFVRRADLLGSDIVEFDMQNKSAKIITSIPYDVDDAAATPPPTVPRILVDTVSVEQQCDLPGKGQVAIICEPHRSTYTFTLNSGQSNTTGLFNGLLPGGYSATITSSGSEVPAKVNFTVRDYKLNNPVITMVKSDPVCNLKGSIKLDAGAADTSYIVQYQGTIYNFDHIFTGLDAGAYHFDILNRNGCLADEKDYALVQQICPPITVTNIKINPECAIYGLAKVQVLTKGHPDTYTYTLNNVTDTTGVFDLVPAGTYTLAITSSGGDSFQQQVTVPDFTLVKPDISYRARNAVCDAAGQVIFSANTAADSGDKISYGTNLSTLNTTITDLSLGSNHFTILSAAGCTLDTLNIDISQDKCIPAMFPNTFTPNNDGINDTFRPNQDATTGRYKLWVYNRWGVLLFQSQSIYNGWDGKYKGKPVPFGVYYWIADYEMPGEQTQVKSGWVTLIR